MSITPANLGSQGSTRTHNNYQSLFVVRVFDMENFCILCNESFAGLEKVTVKKKGVETIKKCSIKRGDGLDRKLHGLEELDLHVSCRKTYISDNMIRSFLKKKRQEPSSEFDYNSKCIFCNECADVNKSNKDELTRTIKMAQTKESIKSYALQRGDSVSEMIMKRIENVDLVAVQAKYHRSCYDMFRFPTTSSVKGSRKRGRPESDSTIKAMNEIFTFIQNHSEECQFTMNDLKGAVSEACPDDRTIIKKIKDKYGDQVNISSSPGKSTLICFGNSSDNILHDGWYTDRCTDAKEERLRIVRTAASIILEDIRSKQYDTSQYPPPDQFVETAKDDVPESLSLLLELLTDKKG